MALVMVAYVPLWCCCAAGWGMAHGATALSAETACHVEVVPACHGAAESEPAGRPSDDADDCDCQMQVEPAAPAKVAATPSFDLSFLFLLPVLETLAFQADTASWGQAPHGRDAPPPAGDSLVSLHCMLTT